jgi:hypothetical protein
MALEGFIPEIWAGTALERLYKSLVFGSVANRDYEGEIRAAGDMVRINQIGIINVSDYVEDSTSITPQTLTDAQKQLLIDQQKYFSFKIEDVSQAQAKPKVMELAMTEAAFRLRDQADQYIASLWTDAGITTGLGTAGTPIDITSVNVIEYLGLVAQKMDENNVPLEGRWGVIPPWFHQKIVLANITLDTDNSEMFRNGFIGRAMGFTFFVSNNVVTSASNANSKIMFGYSGTVTFAEQILSMEAYRPESSFSDAVKGLYVYGAKIVRPDALALLTADYTAEP